MRIAEVYYVGRSRRHSRRAPSGERYSFLQGQRGAEDVPASVESVKDAVYFANSEAFEVKWTAAGHIAKLSQELEKPVEEIGAMLGGMTYREKQRLAKSLGLKAGGAEEELDERLKPEIEKLQTSMEFPDT